MKKTGSIPRALTHAAKLHGVATASLGTSPPTKPAASLGAPTYHMSHVADMSTTWRYCSYGV